MGSSKIENLIDQFNEYIDECKPVMFSKTHIIIQKDTLQEFLDDLRVSTPDEIKRYQKIINNRDAIIKEAEDKAAAIIKAAEERSEKLVGENEIFQRACAKANQIIADAGIRAEAMVSEATNESNRILHDANRDSEKIRNGAFIYANEMLGEIENAIGTAYESINSKSAMLINTLKANLEVIIGNRQELNGEVAPPQPVQQPQEESFQEDANEADFSDLEDEITGLDEDTFLHDAGSDVDE